VAGGDTQKASQLVSTGLFILAIQGFLVLVVGLTFGKLILELPGIPRHNGNNFTKTRFSAFFIFVECSHTHHDL
jgi:hypothetical protein